MNILYEDNDIIIVLKEKGVAIQEDSSSATALINDVNNYIGDNSHIITRLDRPVGGVALFAKNKKAAADLSNLLQQHKIQKVYYAVVCGNPPEKGKLENYLFKNQRQNITKVVNKGSANAKYALLEYEKIAQIEDLALLKINLITGRHHQIRVQFAHFGYPLYGDTKYNPLFKHKRGVDTALFAYKLSFSYKGKDISVSTKPIGEAFEKFSKLF